jgi:hypothetical protein
MLFSRSPMEGDSFVPYVLRLEFEVMRLATNFAGHSCLESKRYGRCIPPRLRGLRPYSWANDPIRIVPLYQRRRNVQRPLFVQQSHRKRATRRVVKSMKFQGNSAGLLLYPADISRGPCIQMWGDLFRTRDRRGPGAMATFSYSHFPPNLPLLLSFLSWRSELCYFQSKTPTELSSFIYCLQVLVGVQNS